MLTIPLYIILFIYFGYLAVFVVFSLLNFYHIISTASFTMASFIISFFVFTLTFLTLYFTWQLLLDVDWKMTINLFNLEWFNGI